MYSHFPYLRTKTDSGEEGYTSSFRLVLYPSSYGEDDLHADRLLTDILWDVALIEWSPPASDDDPEQSSRAYFWARELCKDFSVDLSIQPKIADILESQYYKCDFLDGERRLRVLAQSGRKSLTLSVTDDALEKKEQDLEAQIRRLRIDRIRPY